MSDNNDTRGVSLSKISHVKNISRRIISRIFREGTEVEHAGKVVQLLQTWLKAHEMELADDLEKRVKALEVRQ